MTNPADLDASRSPRVAPSTPGVVLVCETCDHIWEPSPAELGTGPLPCTRCGGWTVIGELATPTRAANPTIAAPISITASSEPDPAVPQSRPGAPTAGPFLSSPQGATAMVIRCFTIYDWSRSYLLPESVTANIPLRGSIGEPGAYNAARGLLVELCRFTDATPLSLHRLEEEHPDELLTTITAHAELHRRPIKVVTQYHMPLRTHCAERWLISINDALLPHEQHRYPPSPPYQGSIVARWLRESGR